MCGFIFHSIIDAFLFPVYDVLFLLMRSSFSLYLFDFQSFYYNVDFFVFILVAVYLAFCIGKCFSSNLGKSFFKIFSVLFFLLPLLFTCMLDCLTCSKSLCVYSLFKDNFSLCCLLLIISIALSSSSLLFLP